MDFLRLPLTPAGRAGPENSAEVAAVVGKVQRRAERWVAVGEQPTPTQRSRQCLGARLERGWVAGLPWLGGGAADAAARVREAERVPRVRAARM